MTYNNNTQKKIQHYNCTLFMNPLFLLIGKIYSDMRFQIKTPY